MLFWIFINLSVMFCLLWDQRLSTASNWIDSLLFSVQILNYIFYYCATGRLLPNFFLFGISEPILVLLIHIQLIIRISFYHFICSRNLCFLSILCVLFFKRVCIFFCSILFENEFCVCNIMLCRLYQYNYFKTSCINK